MNNGAHWSKFFMENPEVQREVEESYGSESGDLPEIDASDHDLARVSRSALAALLAANDPPFLFRYGGLPAWIERDDYKMPFVRVLNQDRMRYLLARKMRWFDEDGAALPPMHVVDDLLAAPDLPLPILTRIVHAPVIARDGSLHTEPGYNPGSRCFYEPARGLVLRPIPERPSHDDVVHALEIVVELICDFPFVSDSERAHAIAFLLLPFVRDLIDGPTPLHLIEKPSPGTGASLLASVLLTLPWDSIYQS